MHKLLSLEGAGSIRIEVAIGNLERSTEAKVSPDTSLLGQETGDLEAEAPEGIHYVARLNEPLLVTQAAGRLLESIVTGKTIESLPRSQSAPSENAFLARLLPSIQAGTRYDINEATECNIQASVAQSSARAFQLISIPFSSPSQLWRMIEIVRQQSMFNELLANLFEGARASQKVDEEAITLDDLLYTNAGQDSISIFVEPDLETFFPSLHISYLLPHVPGWLALSVSMRVSFSSHTSSGLSIAYNLHGGRADLIERVHTILKGNNGDTKLQSVLDATRSPKRCILWLNHRLESAKQQLLQGFSKPDLL